MRLLSLILLSLVALPFSVFADEKSSKDPLPLFVKLLVTSSQKGTIKKIGEMDHMHPAGGGGTKGFALIKDNSLTHGVTYWGIGKGNTVESYHLAIHLKGYEGKVKALVEQTYKIKFPEAKWKKDLLIKGMRERIYRMEIKGGTLIVSSLEGEIGGRKTACTFVSVKPKAE